MSNPGLHISFAKSTVNMNTLKY
uniref:Uncharacterized protein n=1 Tax=Anguilla anguilla TaxID=7936 RepID=A0A0E9VSZ7_ANGAN